ncbi:hypothetical protein BH11PLA2_BH11PLA2_02580 [soil metagenome]
MRKCEANGCVDWRIASDSNTIDADIELFFILMAFHEEKRWIEEPAMRTLMRTILRRAFDHGWLNLAFLSVNSEPAAGFLTYDDANTIHVHNSGLNPAYRDQSPGIVLLGHLIRTPSNGAATVSISSVATSLTNGHWGRN